MIVKVHLVALGRYGEYRMVELPYEAEEVKAVLAESILEDVFHFGQNDHQPQDKPSVSMGDVAELWGRYWLCCSMGWKELTFNEWLDYLGESNLDRIQFAMNPSFV